MWQPLWISLTTSINMLDCQRRSVLAGREQDAVEEQQAISELQPEARPFSKYGAGERRI